MERCPEKAVIIGTTFIRWGMRLLDAVDRKILGLLETDARISFNELGERVGLAKTSCWSRARELEKRGAITGYRAELDPAQLGLHLHAFVHVTITKAEHTAFEEAVSAHHAILECYTTAGDCDYLLHVLVRGIEELDSLLRLEISRMPGVTRLVTTVAMKIIKRRGLITACAAETSP